MIVKLTMDNFHSAHKRVRPSNSLPQQLSLPISTTHCNSMQYTATHCNFLLQQVALSTTPSLMPLDTFFRVMLHTHTEQPFIVFDSTEDNRE